MNSIIKALVMGDGMVKKTQLVAKIYWSAGMHAGHHTRGVYICNIGGLEC